jgi:hypothetical protein
MICSVVACQAHRFAVGVEAPGPASDGLENRTGMALAAAMAGVQRLALLGRGRTPCGVQLSVFPSPTAQSGLRVVPAPAFPVPGGSTGESGEDLPDEGHVVVTGVAKGGTVPAPVAHSIPRITGRSMIGELARDGRFGLSR